MPTATCIGSKPLRTDMGRLAHQPLNSTMALSSLQEVFISPPLLSPPSALGPRLENLPPELISLILSFLPLESLIVAPQLSTLFYQICSSSVLSPWRRPIELALRPPPLEAYPLILGRLGCYSYVPRGEFLEILVRARPDFIATSMELPVGLSSREWEEVMRRRFLPSWRGENWSRTGTSWRSLFMRTIYRVAHRSSTTCTTEELFTRWITLDRRGSATLNRVRASGFDPLAIFQEIKFQNNLHHLPTTVRHVLSLTDVHILAVGVLSSPTSLFVNPNAHAFLQPPLCYPDAPREVRLPSWEVSSGKMKGRERSMSEGGEAALADGSRLVQESGPSLGNAEGATEPGASGANAQRTMLGLPLSRTISGSSSSRRREGGGASTTLASFGSSLSSFLKPRSHPNSSAFSIGTHYARSRELITSPSNLLPASNDPPVTPPIVGPSALTFLTPLPPLHRASTSQVRLRREENVATDRGRLPYRVMAHLTPDDGWRLFPNWTPGGEDTRRRPDGERVGWWERGGPDKEEALDEQEEEQWPEVEGTSSWVGPMMLIAALRTPGDRPFSPSSATSSPPDPVHDEHGHYLLPRPGFYSSFEWEDLWAIAPWMKDEERVGTKTGVGVGFLREGL